MHRLSRWSVRAGAALLLVLPAGAQTLAQRVAAVRQGDVELQFAARAGVCGDGGRSLSIGSSMQMGNWNDDGFRSGCLPGPVRVRLRVEDGAVSEVRTAVGPARPRGTVGSSTDLGVVSARDAVAYLLQLARTANGRVSERAIVPAVLADSSYPWRELLGIARDTTTRSRSTRTSAAFWMSRFAAAKLSGHENDFATEDDEGGERDARGSAIFALSQLRNHEGIPPLIQVARTNHDARLRRQALFWLGQSGDPRGLAVFEEILGGK